jgi:hypothetical protein
MLLSHDSVLRIVSEIKEMNTVFERPEGMGANWENELKYFLEEIEELEDEGAKVASLVGSLDALVDVCVFAVGALHKAGHDAESTVAEILKSPVVEIRAITTPEHYRNAAAGILRTVLLSITTFIGEKRTVECFHEVFLSNMSKLKDGKPVPGNLPGKFGKNLETYFTPDLAKYLK